ncbi:unnamed protein product [Cyprideis torosa]|uniref:Uncharacterized protein n=1 Tax=Cyprideis torosa TaxID=163714 RepID=A0A7R8WGW2_9CRUS|nr:unnamed protein product [Cyprideis torosa]CAG0892195.1 unnamed protein product [Cyprideis torosa]
MDITFSSLFLVVLGVGALVKLYFWLTLGVCRSDKRLDGKTVVVTGANTGIGKETAEDIARRGARVILACRNMEKARKAALDIIAATGNGEVIPMEVDLSRLKSVREFVKNFLTVEDRLDILINNAGMADIIHGRIETEDGLEYHMAANYFGHFLLTNLLIDKLASCAPSRVVNVASVAHNWGKIDLEDLNSKRRYDKKRIYATSKLANVLFATEAAQRFKEKGVTVYALSPGGVSTDFLRNTPLIIQLACKFGRLVGIKSATEGAQTSIYCAVEDGLTSGGYYSDCQLGGWMMNSQTEDVELRRKFWEASAKVVGLD